MDHIPNLSNPCNTCNCFSQYGSIKFVHRITKHFRFIYRTLNTWQFPNISKYIFSLYVCKSWYMILKSCKIYLFARKTTKKAYRTLYTSHNHQTHTVWAWVHEYATPVTLQRILIPYVSKIIVQTFSLTIKCYIHLYWNILYMFQSYLICFSLWFNSGEIQWKGML